MDIRFVKNVLLNGLETNSLSTARFVGLPVGLILYTLVHGTKNAEFICKLQLYFLNTLGVKNTIVKMEISEDFKNFLLTTGDQYVKYIKERQELIDAENLAYDEADRAFAKAENISKLLSEHHKKFKELDIKMKQKLIEVVELVKSKNVS